MATTRILEWLGRFYIVLLLGFLYLPIIIMAAMSFNASPFYQLPFEWTTDWYASLWQNDQLIAATWNSIEIAIITTLISTVLGSMASLALYRYDFRGKKVLQALLFPPIAIPWLITGTAMLIFFFGVGIGRGLIAILLGHVALALPYVIVVVSARLQTFAPELEEAARSLGANQWQVTMRVTLPWIMPGVIAGGLFAFAVSFDQFVVSYFLSTPGQTTLPVEIYAAIRKGFTPEINAVSTIIIVVSMALMLLTARFFKFGGEK
ncbi:MULTISPECIES: ABC transporter permease [unclassified Mesorhizobium]|uniref:ABC transporter permease n=1 Tax=unclassified Mesorhizobium TaxID=325217 RepID=UPI000F76185D|nr:MULTISPECIES: ABC transporter permease [unclassified Mesorhizobium]AZO02457.1 ABC transporter permease [Mesorhizobium sp. M2A.F.Ca.ET.043.02.1.1]RUW40055.1 ABC transporter permease [Mesorhizobium sp. M2A.F.Ca.ET.015.02.1.1]RUW73931.1 ABC transporter permease [Mesorhizobium sp. M2A.F.Ca.ET.067.02.1.1]RVC94237.1 ABC transporter permease [Mesorhizobium sp. M2A.F.Ca.ET.017.03.2.1]RVD09026.1 ABC transporter permease [Mesorhizobium sp. M2A.F.Ca.ET.029.05.1.1]